MGIIVSILSYIFLYLFAIILQGQFRIIFPFLFYPLLFISMFICYLNGRRLKKEIRSFVRMVLISVIPGLLIILILRATWANYYFPWDFALTDVVIPTTVFLTQFIYLVYKNRKKLI